MDIFGGHLDADDVFRQRRIGIDSGSKAVKDATAKFDGRPGFLHSATTGDDLRPVRAPLFGDAPTLIGDQVENINYR